MSDDDNGFLDSDIVPDKVRVMCQYRDYVLIITENNRLFKYYPSDEYRSDDSLVFVRRL